MLGKREQTLVTQAVRGVICESSTEIPVWAFPGEDSQQVNRGICFLRIMLSMLLWAIREARFAVGDNGEVGSLLPDNK